LQRSRYTCVRTVATPIVSSRAISSVESPRATSIITWRSLGVSDDTSGWSSTSAGLRRSQNQFTSRLASTGASVV